MKVNIFFLFIFLWVLFAFFNVFYNTVKIIPEVKEWSFLSDHEKRYKLFGQLYEFYMLVNKQTEPTATIIFYPKDEMSFYLARYYLYPRKIKRADRDNLSLLKKEDVDYLISFERKVLDNVTLISSPSTKSDFFGFLYKLP